METIKLIGILVGQLALVARDPALGARGEALTEALALLGTLIEKGEATRAELEALASQVQGMVADGNRAPTPEEWRGFRDQSRRNHEILNPSIADDKTK